MQLIDDSLSGFEQIYEQFRWSIPERLNIAQQVCDRHQRRADQVAVFYENADGKRASYSFGELKQLSDRLANALRAGGVGAGDRVAIVLPQTIETVVAHLAIHKPIAPKGNCRHFTIDALGWTSILSISNRRPFAPFV